MTTGTLIDGIAASEAIDSSGEIFDVKGADITDLKEGRGLLNFEHKGAGDAKSDSGMDLVGKVIFAKKIYSADDCTSERQKTYWESIELPFIYIVGRLFDGSGHENAKALAAIIKDCVENKEAVMLGFSIEGTTLKREDNRLLSTICRRVAITAKPCNRSCNMDLLANAPKESVTKSSVTKNEFANPDFIKLGGVTEMEFANPFLNEDDLFKATTAGGGDVRPSSLTGGAATTPEDKGLRNRIKSAFRDWDRVSDLGKFLKHKLPEVSEEFIDKFSDSLDDYKVKAAVKRAFKKMLEEEVLSRLTKDERHFRAAGFRHFGSGKVVETGGHHDVSFLPEADQESPGDWEEGFVTHTGGFLNREQAAQSLHVDHPLKSEEVDLDKSMKSVKQLLDGDVEETPVWAGQEDLVMKFEIMEVELKKHMNPRQQDPGLDPVVFQNKQVSPGYGKTHDGQPFDILGHTPTHFMVVPEGRAHGFDHTDLKRVPRGPDFHVTRFPKDLTTDPIVDADQHAVADMMLHPEARDLIHGFDLGQSRSYSIPTPEATGSSSFWNKGPKGQHVFVKEDYNDDGEARKEGLFHNMAKNYFGLGKYVPTTAVAMDPQSGKQLAFIEHAEGSHLHGDNNPQSEEGQHLMRLGDQGELDKMAVMDSVMQNGDRHQHNYMMGGPEGMKLIDHGLIGHGGYYDSRPHYLEAYHEMKTKTNQPHGDLNENTKQWVLGLDPNALANQMRAQQTPEKFITEAMRRLLAMQSYIKAPPKFEKAHGIHNLLNAHSGAIMSRD